MATTSVSTLDIPQIPLVGFDGFSRCFSHDDEHTEEKYLPGDHER